MTQDIEKDLLIPLHPLDRNTSILKKICFVDEPVQVSDSQAVFRISLNSNSLRNFVSNRQETLEEDQIICSKISLLA